MKDTSVPTGESKAAFRDLHLKNSFPCSKDDGDAFPSSGRVGPLQLADVHRCVQHAIDRYWNIVAILQSHKCAGFILIPLLPLCLGMRTKQ